MPENMIATTGERERLALFLLELREKGRRPRTLRHMKLDWSQFAAWYAEVNQERFNLERLAAMDVQDYVTWSQQQGLKASTINRRLAWIKQYSAWGVERGVVNPDMGRRIKAIPVQRKQQLAPRSLSSREARKLLKEVKVRGNTRDVAILSTLITLFPPDGWAI